MTGVQTCALPISVVISTLSDAVMICKEEITTDDTVKYNDVEHTPLKIKPRSDLDGNEMYRKVIF